MMVREHTEEPPEHDPVAQRIAEDERRRSGAFLRDYLLRHRIDLETGATGVTGAGVDAADANGSRQDPSG